MKNKNRIYYLSTCSTCQKILQSLNTRSCQLIDIKESPISETELDFMAKMAGSYEALFSRRAIKYRSMGLQDKNLNEIDYRKLILDEYTFLKRPVILVGNQIFIGNAASSVESARKALQ